MFELTPWRPSPSHRLLPYFQGGANWFPVGFEALLQQLFGGGEPQGVAWWPRAEVLETPEAYWVRVELVGVEPSEVEVRFARGELTIRGEKRRAEPLSGERVHGTERGYGPFERSFRFAEALDAASIVASSRHGVLQVELPKASGPGPRTVEVRPG